MLQKLTKIKNQITLQLVSVKVNIFIPKLYKINLINFLLVVYVNLKNNAIKVTNSEWPLSFFYYTYMYVVMYYIIFEVIFWVILYNV